MGYSALPVVEAGVELSQGPIVVTCGAAGVFEATDRFALFNGEEVRSWRVANVGGAGTSDSVLDFGGGAANTDMADRLKVAIDAAGLGFSTVVAGPTVTISVGSATGIYGHFVGAGLATP